MDTSLLTQPLLYVGIGFLIAVPIGIGDSRRLQGTKVGPWVGALLLALTILVRWLLYPNLLTAGIFGTPLGVIVAMMMDYALPTAAIFLLVKEGI